MVFRRVSPFNIFRIVTDISAQVFQFWLWTFLSRTGCRRKIHSVRPMIQDCRSQWPRGLRRRSAAARLLRLWVRIPPGACISVVSVVRCQVEVSATSWSLVQRSPTDCGASLCVIQKPREWEGPGPLRAFAPNKKRGGGQDWRQQRWFPMWGCCFHIKWSLL